jgi:hypothetical protein
MPTFVIHGDVSPLEGAETIETRDALARHMFVTIEPGAPREVWIRAVLPEELASFRGLLYQIDKDADETIILRQACVEFWPFRPGGDCSTRFSRPRSRASTRPWPHRTAVGTPRSETA